MATELNWQTLAADHLCQFLDEHPEVRLGRGTWLHHLQVEGEDVFLACAVGTLSKLEDVPLPRSNFRLEMLAAETGQRYPYPYLLGLSDGFEMMGGAAWRYSETDPERVFFDRGAKVGEQVAALRNPPKSSDLLHLLSPEYRED